MSPSRRAARPRWKYAELLWEQPGPGASDLVAFVPSRWLAQRPAGATSSGAGSPLGGCSVEIKRNVTFPIDQIIRNISADVITHISAEIIVNSGTVTPAEINNNHHK